MKKSALIAIPAAAALAVAAYVFLAGGPEGPEAPAESAPAHAAPERASAGGVLEAQPARAAQESGSSATLAAEERPPEWESKTKGDLTTFSLTHGEIGYVDVDSVLQDRNPYSVVDLLQAHQDLTGADESLEITIDRIEETEIWGHEALFTQLIEGQPTNEGGRVFFSSSGAESTRVYGRFRILWSAPGMVDTAGPQNESPSKTSGHSILQIAATVVVGSAQAIQRFWIHL